MSQLQNHPNRRSIRLRNYDYTQPGAYFITICTYQMKHTLSNIENGTPFLTRLGVIAYAEWFNTAQLRSNVQLHKPEFVIMPNHLHGIIWITDFASDPTNSQNKNGSRKTKQISLGVIVGQFKAAVTKHANRLRKSPARIWHRNYWEHVVRDEKDLERIQRYIYNNPGNWRKRQS